MNKRFRFQSVLDYKRHRVDQLQMELACKQQELDRLRSELRLWERKRDEVSTRLRDTMTGVLPIDTVRLTYQYLAYIDQQIAKEVEKIELAESQIEVARASLTEALKERKTFEKLREYAVANFQALANRREAAMVDDLNIAKYSHGGDE